MPSHKKEHSSPRKWRKLSVMRPYVFFGLSLRKLEKDTQKKKIISDKQFIIKNNVNYLKKLLVIKKNFIVINLCNNANLTDNNNDLIISIVFCVLVK